MSRLRQGVEEYLKMRRSLGFQLRQYDALLRDFVSLLEREGASHITNELSIRWAKLPCNAQPLWWALRLSKMRGFARYWSAVDPRTEVPPLGLIPPRYQRRQPYIYADEEVTLLMEAARELAPANGLRPWTYSTMFGLLAATGVRLCEALALNRDEIDWTQGVLGIHQTKFGKSRLIPIHESTLIALEKYAHRRDQIHSTPSTKSFFLSLRGTRLTQWSVRRTFVQLSHQIGLRSATDRHGPHLHDFRHRFAVKTLLGWYRAGVQVERHMPLLSTYLGHTRVAHTYWYLSAVPERAAGANMRSPNMKLSSNLATSIECFFSDRLMKQLQASQNTVASYRDTFRLLLRYAQEQLGKQPSALCLEDLDAPFIGAFLDYLEKERGNTARTRNARLAAIHSFFRFMAYQEPAHSALIQRVLAMPSKRFEKASVEFLTRPEVDALLDAPDRKTWGGRRDHTLFLVDVDTGLRVSELVGLRCEDVVLGVGAHVRCQGKGRKERCTPLTKKTVAALRSWLQERDACPSDPLFPNARGGTLSRDGVEYILAKHLKVARQSCPSLNNKRVSPHVLRHTAAMDLLHSGVDRSVIALWLGHESVDTTQLYIDANLAMKEEALSKVTPRNVRPGRFRADDQLLAFLNSL